MLDLILIVIVVAFAVSGYRQGFIVGVLSFFGFVGGALLGAEFGPSISRAIVGGQTQQDVIAVVLVHKDCEQFLPDLVARFVVRRAGSR